MLKKIEGVVLFKSKNKIMYKHQVQYYETDKMGITHHSNYIRWMEEARVEFLDRVGYGFEKMEEIGIISPIVSVECSYKKSTRFPEIISIDLKVEEFKGVKLKLVYKMYNAQGELCCEGHSVQAFLDENGRPIRFKEKYPGLYQIFLDNMVQ